MLTVANQLTMIRMVMIPLLVMDGILARHMRQSSRLGAFLDPTADKLLMTACFVVLSIPDHPKSIPDFEIANHLPVYLTIVTISRDVFIVMIALIIHLSSGIRSFPPTSLGKVTTATQILTVGVVLLVNALSQPCPILVQGLGWITLTMTVSSGLHYIYHAARLAESGSGAPPG